MKALALALALRLPIFMYLSKPKIRTGHIKIGY